jgi:hypothetical protein
MRTEFLNVLFGYTEASQDTRMSTELAFTHEGIRFTGSIQRLG